MRPIVLLLALTGVASGEWSFDSPVRSSLDDLSLSSRSSVLFELTEPATIQSMEGYLFCWPGKDGTAFAQILSHVNGLPGDVLHSSTFYIPETPASVFVAEWRRGARWQGAYDLDWELQPGQYWASFSMPDDERFGAGIDFGNAYAPVTLAYMRQFAIDDDNCCDYRWEVSPDVYAAPRMRINSQLVPEPACNTVLVWCAAIAHYLLCSVRVAPGSLPTKMRT